MSTYALETRKCAERDTRLEHRGNPLRRAPESCLRRARDLADAQGRARHARRCRAAQKLLMLLSNDARARDP